MIGHSEHTPDPGAVVQMPPMPAHPPPRRALLIAGFAIAVLLALTIGVAIGRATVEAPAADRARSHRDPGPRAAQGHLDPRR
jgi:hypothetical protein